MSFVSVMAITASRLITTKGRQISYAHITSGVYDPATGKAVEASSSDAPMVAVEYQRRTRGQDQQQESEAKIYIPAAQLSSAPKANDVATFDGASWRVLDVSTTEAQGIAILYTVRVQRV